MTIFILVRHGPTHWNTAGRIQGHTDIPLSDEGQARAGMQRIPAIYSDAAWVSSPLIRAMQTAQQMGCVDPVIEPALIEMNWGEWEGLTLSELQQNYGDELKTNEDRGLNFRPSGGESPRDVRLRVLRWMREASESAAVVVAVTHKGVIRAMLSEATGWDMTGPPPLKLAWTCAHVFELDRHGQLSLHEANVSLRSHL